MGLAKPARPDSAPRSDVSDTRMLLIHAAERLFAEQGLRRTSLRQINQEAGQRNESAIHYHFGSRDAVILAIVELRTGPINERRLQMLAAALRDAGKMPLSSTVLAKTIVLPLAQSIAADPTCTHYARFLTQLTLDPDSRRLFLGGPHEGALAQCLKEFVRSKPYYPEPVHYQRFTAAARLMIAMLGIIEEMADTRKARDKAAAEKGARVANIIDMVTAILDAPISPDALLAQQALDKSQPANS